MATSIGRREFVARGAAGAVGVGLAGRSPGPRADGLPRVAIVGGGLAGVACGWLLEGVARATLVEARPSLGGHADSLSVDVDGEPVVVDLGAQFFAPGPHPTYVALLDLLGLRDPGAPASDATLEADMTVSVTEAGRDEPRFVSPSTRRLWPLLAPWNARGLLAFLVFALAARRLVEDAPHDLTVQAWLDGLPVGAEERERLLLPLIGALAGCSIEQARALSAPGAVLFVAKALPENLLQAVRYGNSLLGLQGNVERIAADAPGLAVRLGEPALAVVPRLGGGHLVVTAAAPAVAADVVILAAPPYVAEPLLRHVPWLWRARAALRAFEHFDADLVVHRDPVYMPSHRARWSAYNADLAGGFCEGSVWYGALRPPPPGHARLSLFKSWASARGRAPSRIVAARRFRHPLVTPAFLRAQRRLASLQGRAGVWFAGAYTAGVDSQESALLSAVSVVERLFPAAPNLLALRTAAPAAGAPRALGPA